MVLRLFLVTANVGSVFENLDKGLEIWMNEFIKVMRSKDPDFVGIHFQETGGKCYENGSNCVDTFFGCLVDRMSQLNYRRGQGFIDSRSELEDQFTALSNVYFVHERVQPHSSIAIWDFQAKRFHELDPSSPQIYKGAELDKTGKKEKEKFPQNFYPNCKWSRKGFIRTRWLMDGRIVDFVNIHLFHDADNEVAASAFPSEFAQSRNKALSYTMNRLGNNPEEQYPLFIYGDFNFRLNTHGVVNHLKNKIEDVGNSLEIGTKKWDMKGLEKWFLHSHDWLKQYDFERLHLLAILDEHEVNFHPTYPFEEDDDKPEMFMRTRCPAWCDRVLFTQQTKKDIISKELPIEYNILGSKTCMGDHKPVYLTFTLNKKPNPAEPSPSDPFLSGYRMSLCKIDDDDEDNIHTAANDNSHNPPNSSPSIFSCCIPLRRRSKSKGGLTSPPRKSRNNNNSSYFRKKQSLASDAISINPPSSSYSDTTNSSSRNSTINSHRRRRNNKTKGFPRNLNLAFIKRRRPPPLDMEPEVVKNKDDNDKEEELTIMNMKNAINRYHGNHTIINPLPPLIISCEKEIEIEKDSNDNDNPPSTNWPPNHGLTLSKVEVPRSSRNNGKCSVM